MIRYNGRLAKGGRQGGTTVASAWHVVSRICDEWGSRVLSRNRASSSSPPQGRESRSSSSSSSFAPRVLEPGEAEFISAASIAPRNATGDAARSLILSRKSAASRPSTLNDAQ